MVKGDGGKPARIEGRKSRRCIERTGTRAILLLIGIQEWQCKQEWLFAWRAASHDDWYLALAAQARQAWTFIGEGERVAIEARVVQSKLMIIIVPVLFEKCSRDAAVPDSEGGMGKPCGLTGLQESGLAGAVRMNIGTQRGRSSVMQTSQPARRASVGRRRIKSINQ